MLFRKLCSSCHTVGVGPRIGPDLYNVTERHDEAWLRAFIADPRRMVRKGDAKAIALDQAFPGVTMPRLGLAEEDLTDVLSFLKSKSAQIKVGDSAVVHDHSDHQHGGVQ